MEEKVTHEKKDIDFRAIIVANIFTGILFVIIVVFGLILFFSYRDYQYKNDINSSGIDQEVKKVREYENNELNNYGFLDKEKGIIRIPVEKAIEETIKDYNNK